jgi:hypothetical protein
MIITDLNQQIIADLCGVRHLELPGHASLQIIEGNENVGHCKSNSFPGFCDN